MRYLVMGAALLLAAGCAEESRFVGFNKCAPDGSSVWFQVPNVNGTYDGAKASEENCK